MIVYTPSTRRRLSSSRSRLNLFHWYSVGAPKKQRALHFFCHEKTGNLPRPPHERQVLAVMQHQARIILFHRSGMKLKFSPSLGHDNKRREREMSKTEIRRTDRGNITGCRRGSAVFKSYAEKEAS